MFLIPHITENKFWREIIIISRHFNTIQLKQVVKQKIYRKKCLLFLFTKLKFSTQNCFLRLLASSI